MWEILHFLNAPEVRGFGLGLVLGGAVCVAWMWLRPVTPAKRGPL